MIGSGAFSTVFAARDVAVGTLMCAKQVMSLPVCVAGSHGDILT